MLFPTVNFGIFFILVFAAAWLLVRHHRWRLILLTSVSYVFYAFWDWRFCFLLLFSSVVNWYFGELIYKSEGKARQNLVAGAVTVDLAVLGFFKYYNFFLSSLNATLEHLGARHDIPYLDIVLPVGISFFTFHAISYVVDIYRKKLDRPAPLLHMLLYISFFPQLVAGPIVRASHFLPQLEHPVDPDDIRATRAYLLILGGMFKKVVVSSFLATSVVEPVFFDPGSFGARDLLLAVYGYALQIYCDFSAYTDIAIGVAALLGYRFPENFDQPYRAIGFRDFWRRWHISLSSWLRDYLYIPLGGNTGDWRRYKNLMITMLLGGLWHGAAWNFAIWGGIHGGLLVAEHRFLGEHWTESAKSWVKVLGTVITFQLVCLTWIFFRAVDLPHALSFIGGFSRVSAASTLATPFTLILISVLLAAQFLPTDRMAILERYAIRMPPIAQGAVAGALMIAIFSIGPSGIAPFIYFQF